MFEYWGVLSRGRSQTEEAKPDKMAMIQGAGKNGSPLLPERIQRADRKYQRNFLINNHEYSFTVFLHVFKTDLTVVCLNNADVHTSLFE